MLNTIGLLATLLLPAAGGSGTIVQSGSLSGGAAPMFQDVILEQFDDQGGTLALQSVRLEVLTSVIGGCTSTGLGPPDTAVFAQLDGDFHLRGQLLVATEAIISALIDNSGPQTSLTFFDTDQGELLLDRPGDLAPWIGRGDITLSAFTRLQIDENPPDTVFFSAGGGIHWKVTYTFADASGGTTFVEGFEDGTNEAGWSWGTGGETIEPINGNPGAYLQDLTLASCCPVASTGLGVGSEYTGDYRAQGVTSVGIDLITINASSGVGGRPLSVILLNDNRTPFFFDDDLGAFFVGDKNIPDAGVPALTPAGWTPFDFDVPSGSTALPAGWQTFDPDGVGASDAVWNAVIGDVDALQFFYGDPTKIHLFLSWDVGLDNPRITKEPLGGLTAGLDVRPGSCPNPVNLHGKGFVPVALVGSAAFDVAQVDLASLRLERQDGVGAGAAPHQGPPGPHAVLADVATPFDGRGCECDDAGADGTLDLLLFFRTDVLVAGLDLGSVSGGSSVPLVLRGTLADGTPFTAEDCILIVPALPNAPLRKR